MNVGHYINRIPFFALVIAMLVLLPMYALAFDLVVRVDDNSVEVIGGDRVYYEVDIKYPENTKRADLRVESELIDKNGNAVASSESLRAVETQASFVDYMVVPKDVDAGLYDVKVEVKDYDGTLDKEAVTSFKVLKGADEIKTYFYILLGMIAFVGLLVMLQLFLMNRRRP